VFRIPHNLEVQDFDQVWGRAALALGGLRVPDTIDLLLTKEETTRPQDKADIAFLENKVRMHVSDKLQHCVPDEAKAVFERYADHDTCRAALQNPDPCVQEMGRALLRQWAESGDPFAREVLNEFNTG
jgi:hypothetical protein